MNERTLSTYLKRLACPRCRKRYDESDLLFIVGSTSGRELNLRCARCRLRIRLALPVERKKRTDPDKSRAGSRRRSRGARKPISQTDVVEMRRFLAEFRGNFADLLHPS